MYTSIQSTQQTSLCKEVSSTHQQYPFPKPTQEYPSWFFSIGYLIFSKIYNEIKQCIPILFGFSCFYFMYQ